MEFEKRRTNRFGKGCGSVRRIFALLLIMILLCGCAVQQPEPAYITVSLVLPEGCSVPENGLRIPSGEDAVFELILENGYELVSIDYDGEYTVEEKKGILYLCLKSVRYPTLAPVNLTSCYCSITYEPNGSGGRGKTVAYDRTEHLRPNTSIGTDIFTRDGYTLTGWNTMPDGSGMRIGLGSRATVPGVKLTLYAQWAPWSPEGYFDWERTDSGVRITGYRGNTDTVVVPGILGDGTVTSIGAGAFVGCRSNHIILPPTLKTVEPGAFVRCDLEKLTFFDNIEDIWDNSFVDCRRFSTVYINAVEAPYGFDYRRESCFADKMDILIEAQGQRKLVFYGGCSMWYNLDGQMAQNAVGDGYRVINLGLNGVINSSAQMQIMGAFLEPGDVFFHTPETSSASQMMWRREMINHDRKLWSGMEYNYDLVSLLDIRTLPHFFDIFQYWLSRKECTSSYTDVYRDSLGNRYVDGYGCASFPRRESEEELDDKVYLDPACFGEEAMAVLEDHYRVMMDRGVKIYVGHACVNMDAVPEDQRENVALMDVLFRQTFSSMEGITVVGSLSDYLYCNSDFYDTNYHLLTETSRQNTQKWLEDLAEQMIKDGLWPES